MNLRTNSSKTTFEENTKISKSRLLAIDYPKNLPEKKLSDVKFTEKSSTLRGMLVRAKIQRLHFKNGFHLLARRRAGYVSEKTSGIQGTYRPVTLLFPTFQVFS